jgi:hypothetical protein
MKLKDFLRDLECNRNTVIKFRWIDNANETVYSEVEYNSNRWSIFDTDDMFDELILLWGNYIVGHWCCVNGNKIIIDMYKEG